MNDVYQKIELFSKLHPRMHRGKPTLGPITKYTQGYTVPLGVPYGISQRQGRIHEYFEGGGLNSQN